MAVTPIPAEDNLIKSADLNGYTRDVAYVMKFTGGIKKLMEALSITDMIPRAAGTKLVAYKAAGTLDNTVVKEGEVIPLSKYETVPVEFPAISFDKWAKATSLEGISEKGKEQAVNKTDEKMIKDVQAKIRNKWFTFLANGSATAEGTGLQDTLAHAWATLQTKFEDDTIEAVYFVNYNDIADYLGTHTITLESAFGMDYVENFLGLGTVFLSSSVPVGTVYATAKENICLYYVNANDSDYDEFELTTDETGLIGVTREANKRRAQLETIVYSGIALFAERLDGIVVATQKADTPSAEG